MEHFVIIVQGWRLLDVAAVLDPPLKIIGNIRFSRYGYTKCIYFI